MSVCVSCGRNDQEPLAPCPRCAIGDQADPALDELVFLRGKVARLEAQRPTITQELEIDRLRGVLSEVSNDRDQLWALSEDRGRLVEKYRAETARLRQEVAAKPDPDGGEEAKRQAEWLRPKLQKAEAALERADRRAGWGFTGPCVHGRDPFDRCDTCGELEPHQAAVLVAREACAKVVESGDFNKPRDGWSVVQEIAAAIRAGGES